MVIIWIVNLSSFWIYSCHWIELKTLPHEVRSFMNSAVFVHCVHCLFNHVFSFLYRPSSTSSTSSIPHLPVKSLGSSNSSSSSSIRKNNIPSSSNQGSNSMLEKFKLFNPKDKNQEKTKGKFSVILQHFDMLYVAVKQKI